jgi:hypothetical protein
VYLDGHPVPESQLKFKLKDIRQPQMSLRVAAVVTHLPEKNAETVHVGLWRVVDLAQ